MPHPRYPSPPNTSLTPLPPPFRLTIPSPAHIHVSGPGAPVVAEVRRLGVPVPGAAVDLAAGRHVPVAHEELLEAPADVGDVAQLPAVAAVRLARAAHELGYPGAVPHRLKPLVSECHAPERRRVGARARGADAHVVLGLPVDSHIQHVYGRAHARVTEPHAVVAVLVTFERLGQVTARDRLRAQLPPAQPAEAHCHHHRAQQRHARAPQPHDSWADAKTAVPQTEDLVAKEVSTWTNAAGELLCVPVYVNCMALTDPANLFPQMERAIEAAQAAHHSSPSNHGGRKGGRQRGGTGRARTSGDGEGAREAVLSLLQQEVQEERAEQAEGIESRLVEGEGARDATEEARSSGEDDDVVEVVAADARQAGAAGQAGGARQEGDAGPRSAGPRSAGKGRVTRGTGGGRSGEKDGGGARRVLRLREGEGGKGQAGGRANAGGDKRCGDGGTGKCDGSSGGGKGGRKPMM
ncbi:unnamed protein product [Closterium sp. NIES-53]